MNKILKYIILLTAGLLTLASPTCEEEVSPEQRRKKQLERLQTVAWDLRSESLTSKNLEAFEFKAVEKLMDYGDYLGIVYNNEADNSFRDQAQENINRLFTGHSAPDEPVPAHINPDLYNTLQFLIDSIEIINPLYREVTETYRGNMQYSLQILGITSADTIILESSINKIDMILQMGYKEFGENSLLIWEILLSDNISLK